MDFIFLIQSISKVAMIAFLATLTVICYEVYFLIKEKNKNKKPVIPAFESNKSYGKIKIVPIKKEKEKKEGHYKQSSRLLFFSSGFIFLLLVIFFILGIFLDNKETIKMGKTQQISPIIKSITSVGVKLYDLGWHEIEDNAKGLLKPGVTIYMGIETISGVTIDKARIRVNSTIWSVSDETELFNKDFDVYYKEYKIATNESVLTIEAQLHDSNEGWLGK